MLNSQVAFAGRDSRVTLTGGVSLGSSALEGFFGARSFMEVFRKNLLCFVCQDPLLHPSQ